MVVDISKIMKPFAGLLKKGEGDGSNQPSGSELFANNLDFYRARSIPANYTTPELVPILEHIHKSISSGNKISVSDAMALFSTFDIRQLSSELKPFGIKTTTTIDSIESVNGQLQARSKEISLAPEVVFKNFYDAINNSGPSRDAFKRTCADLIVRKLESYKSTSPISELEIALMAQKGPNVNRATLFDVGNEMVTHRFVDGRLHVETVAVSQYLKQICLGHSAR